MAQFTLFYGTQIVGEFDTLKGMRLDMDITSDIYQGGYYYRKFLSDDGGSWFRMDMTPVLLEDVPKQLRTMALLLNL